MFAVEMHDITKSFHGTPANDSVSLKVRPQSVHALVGENGAGKSTLMKILYGMHTLDRGSIAVNGTKVTISSPAVAIRHGIGMVHQHFMLVPTLTVTENVILGMEPTRRFSILDIPKATHIIQDLSKKYHIEIDPDATINDLSVGLQQRIEILKILYRNSQILILDEPTAVLTPQEVEELFRTIRRLKEDGKTIIIITHKLREIMGVSDMVTVLRQGKKVFESSTQATNAEELSFHMVGRAMSAPLERLQHRTTDTALEVNNISSSSAAGVPALHDISFSLNHGEILGMAGVEGNGQTTLVDVLCGRRAIDHGSLRFLQNDSSLLSQIPEDRHKHGLVLSFSARDNFILGRQSEKRFSGNLMLRKKAISSFAQTMVQQYDIRPPEIQRNARSFSGGNQQKIVIARELDKGTSVIIAAQPTRGLDIGAQEYVHRKLIEQRNAGRAILLISSDLPELLALSDRIMVMYAGSIIATMTSEECTEALLGKYMTGASRVSA